ncbi:NYN domain-containing protein [Pseudonocardia kunmingensis]|uniref:NYN domain-containing protein n=1 Tax=Pseudonocardia kunmingensis TaxID=630975 RepID=UPI0014792A5A
MHLTGHDLFESNGPLARHETLVDPLHLANQLLRVRNERQQQGMAHAVLSRVLVYRGEPSPNHDARAYARNQAQKAQWERDPRVEVNMRPLKYEYERDANGRKASGPDGKWIVTGRSEKGVDVLCALALVREARQPDVDLVILASHDSDLDPALDEAAALGSAKVETFCWFDPAQPHRARRKRQTRRNLWYTPLGHTEFVNSRDRTIYK